jgi:asparagine synthase (glutamine-hydrolysing)
MGFAVPLASWFRGPLREKIRKNILGSTMMETGLFEPAYLKSLVDQHQSGRWDHSSAIWTLLMFEEFLNS